MRYNGPGNAVDMVHAITIGIGSDILITGESQGIADLDCATLKLNKCGDVLWSNRYNNWVDIGYDVTTDAWGRVIVGGMSQEDIFYFKNQFLLLKYGVNGNQMWYKRDGPYGDDAIYKVALDNSGNIYAAGITCIYDEPNHQKSDFVLLKYDENGNPIWDRHYGLPQFNDVLMDMTIGQDNYIYVTGSIETESTVRDWATLKYDASGNLLWDPPPTYNGSANLADVPQSLAVDAYGSVYVTGYSHEYDIPPGSDEGLWKNFTTIKYGSSGDQIWVSRIRGTGSIKHATGNSITISNNKAVATGWVHQSNYDYENINDCVTIKYSDNSVPVWTAVYSYVPWGNDEGMVVKSDQEGNIYVGARSYKRNLDPYSYDIATIKYSSAGIEEWSSRYNGPDDDVDEPMDLAIDGDAVYTAGWSNSFTTGFDYIIVKNSPSWLPPICDDQKSEAGLTLALRNLVKLNDSSAIAVGDQGTIKVTSDRGLNWKNIPTEVQNRINAIDFNNCTGIIAGENGMVWYTSNSGNNWTVRSTPFSKEIKSVQLLGSNTIYCTGEKGLLYRSTNSGINWLDLSLDSSYSLNSIFFIDNWRGFVVGSHGVIMASTNSGLNWNPLNSPTTNELNKICFKDNENGFIVGELGTLLLTSNSGDVWQKKQLEYENDFKSVCFVSTQSAYIVGSTGLILHSTNDGLSWTKEETYLISDVMDLIFLDSNKGIAVTSDSKIALTSKGEIFYNKSFDYASKNYNFENVTEKVDYQLYQNYPNPFNPTTNIKFYLPADCKVTLSVYDVTGRLVGVLVNDYKKKGIHSAIFDGTNVSSGVYFYRLLIFSEDAQDVKYSISNKMLILK